MDVRGGLVDPVLVRGMGESQTEHSIVIRTHHREVVTNE
jgi:hypothetical protein